MAPYKDIRCIYAYEHEQILQCRYCSSRWMRGRFKGMPYRIDKWSGWWEIDNGECYCTYFTKDGSLMSPGKLFYSCHFTPHYCDCPTHNGVRDADNGVLISWNKIIPIAGFWRLSKLWRQLQQRKQQDVEKEACVRLLNSPVRSYH